MIMSMEIWIRLYAYNTAETGAMHLVTGSRAENFNLDSDVHLGPILSENSLAIQVPN